MRMICVSIGFLMPLFRIAPFLVVSNVLTTVGMLYFGTIWNTRQFAIISSYSPTHQARIFIWREAFLNIARIVVLMLVLPLQQFAGAWFILLLVIALSGVAAIHYFSGKSTDLFEREAV